MREIIFRGKCVGSDAWIMGDLLHSHGRTLIASVNDNDGFEIVAREVYANSVGQFIGIRNENGTPIFEGDIVVHPDKPGTFIVVYDEDGKNWWVAINEESDEDCFFFDEINCSLLTVVGNWFY